MKLTEKDKEFIEKLKMLIEDRDLKIELKEDGLKRFVLRRNYGDKIERIFGLTRQGIRWRFQRLLGDIYISAYEIRFYWVESHLRDRAQNNGARHRKTEGRTSKESPERDWIR